jgi:hypothetical protein
VRHNHFLRKYLQPIQDQEGDNAKGNRFVVTKL